jgi:AcrR family transcriptional regulator
MVRPRSPEAHEKVLHAALALFGERGIEGASMDAIARAAQVSKATIYNHWPDKEALLLEVMLWVNGLNPNTDREKADPDSGSLERDLAIVLGRHPPRLFDEARKRITPSLIAYSATHKEFGLAWRNTVMEPPRQCLRRILRRAQHRGQIQPNLDLDTAMAILLGPMLYQHIFEKGVRRSRSDIASHVAQTFCKAFAVGVSK